jgi:hypothetical protein
MDFPAPIPIESFQRDGRPLCTVPITSDGQAKLGTWLKSQIQKAEVTKRTAIYFVLWAAEHIRSNFRGGPLTWNFVFSGLGLPENQKNGQILVSNGLSWWKRSVRVTEANVHLYLYSLMAEGGLPEALLVQPGLYGRVVKGLLGDFEAEGSVIPEDLAYRIAAERVAELPQTFRTYDITRLLAEFGSSLTRLRRMPPQDIPAEAIDRWLDLHHPNWIDGVPMRISRDVADQLIRPALRVERTSVAHAYPVAQRTLIRSEGTKRWTSAVRLASKGAISQSLLPPSAQGLRLRFQLMGELTDRGNPIVYSGSPTDAGWDLQRLGRGADLLEFALQKPVMFAGYADGRLVGEVEIIPALVSEDEPTSFWKDDTLGLSDEDASELLQLGAGLKTRLPRIWLLAHFSGRPGVGPGVVCGERQEAAEGWLWPLQGKGSVTVQGESWQIVTEADQDSSSVRLLCHGQILPSWRLATTGGQIYLGRPVFYGQINVGEFRAVSGREIKIRAARTILSEIAEWFDRANCIARLRYVALPDSVRIQMGEESAGNVALSVEGFPAEEDWAIVLEVGSTTQRARLVRGKGTLSLKSEGAPPGIVWLRISSPVKGEIKFYAPWPSRNGFLLRPDGRRLERNTLVSVEALRGWLAVVPQGHLGEAFFRLDGHSIAIRVNAETSLTAFIPLIRSLLAYAGPDAVVKLSLLTDGVESPRLDVRRYEQGSECSYSGKLRLGLNPTNLLSAGTGRIAADNVVHLHAVNIENPEMVERAHLEERESPVEIDLCAVLPEGGGGWLLQPRLNGRVQRAAIWFPVPQARSSREQRIREYAEEWRQLAAAQERAVWNQRWELIQTVMEGGDAGILDQVQALAHAPAAAVRLLLSVSKADLPQALGLDLAAPIFWPMLPAAAFADALKAEYGGLKDQLMAIFENENEATAAALERVSSRIEAILTLRPELAAHFGMALMEAGLFGLVPQIWHKVAVPQTPEKLIELAHEAARRLDWLPSGLEALVAHHRPEDMPTFNPYTQNLVDAPLITAEIAAGARTVGDLSTTLRLIVLRLADPHYFDSAMPLALAFVLKEVSA